MLLAGAASHAVRLAAISLRRPAGSTLTHSEERLQDVVSLGCGRAVIIEAFARSRGIYSLGDQLGDVDDALALVHACFDVIANSHM